MTVERAETKRAGQNTGREMLLQVRGIKQLEKPSKKSRTGSANSGNNRRKQEMSGKLHSERENSGSRFFNIKDDKG